MVVYLLQSIVLGVAASWMAWLHLRRGAGVVAAFGALYLVLPAGALLLQALGVDAGVAAPAQWSSVLVTAALTAAMAGATWRSESPVAVALRVAEREREAADLRARAYLLAGMVLGDAAAD